MATMNHRQGLAGELLKHFTISCELDGFCRCPADARHLSDVDAYRQALRTLRKAGLIRIEGYRHGLGGFFVYLVMPGKGDDQRLKSTDSPHEQPYTAFPIFTSPSTGAGAVAGML